MSSAFRGKLIENIVIAQLDKPASRTASTVLYNGVAATTTSYLDCLGYDEVVITLNKGTFTGTAAVSAYVVGGETTDPSAGTKITGSDFTDITSANDEAVESVSIQVKNQNRYLWLYTSKTNVNSDAGVWGATAILKTGAYASTVTTTVKADI